MKIVFVFRERERERKNVTLLLPLWVGKKMSRNRERTVTSK